MPLSEKQRKMNQSVLGLHAAIKSAGLPEIPAMLDKYMLDVYVSVQAVPSVSDSYQVKNRLEVRLVHPLLDDHCVAEVEVYRNKSIWRWCRPDENIDRCQWFTFRADATDAERAKAILGKVRQFLVEFEVIVAKRTLPAAQCNLVDAERQLARVLSEVIALRQQVAAAELVLGS